MKSLRGLWFIFAGIILVFCLLFYYWTVVPREGTLVVKGEGIYTGQLRGFTFHGKGKWETNFGVTYEGNFRDGMFHGYGVMTFANGSKYEGLFERGHMHGYGIMTFSDGHTHNGLWDQSHFEGDVGECDHGH